MFYKIKNNETVVYFRADAPLYTSEEVTRYAMENGLVEKSDKRFEAFTAPSDEYREYLVNKIYTIFGKYLDEIKSSWTKKSLDEIMADCQMTVYISDIMHVFDDADATMFDYEALEQWLAEPDKMVTVLCDRVRDRSSSDYNEAIFEFINQGLEV